MLMNGAAGAETRGAEDAGEAEQEGQDVLMIAENDTVIATVSEDMALELARSTRNAEQAGHEAEATLITPAGRGAAIVEVGAADAAFAETGDEDPMHAANMFAAEAADEAGGGQQEAPSAAEVTDTQGSPSQAEQAAGAVEPRDEPRTAALAELALEGVEADNGREHDKAPTSEKVPETPEAQGVPVVKVVAEGAGGADKATQDTSQDARRHDNVNLAARGAAPHAEASEECQEQACTVTEVIEVTIEVPAEALADGRSDAAAGAIEHGSAQKDGAGAEMVAAEAEVDAEAAAAEVVVAALSAAEAENNDGGPDRYEGCEGAELDILTKEAGGEESAGAEGKLPAPLWERFHGAGHDTQDTAHSGPQERPELCCIGWKSR